MFWNAVGMRGNKILMRQKKLGIWHEWTWAQVAEAVREIGNGLLSLGLRPGDCASIQANTVVEWVFADIAILSAGGVCSGIYPTDAAPQVQYLCADSRTRFLFVEDDEQLDKALEVRAQLPLLKKVIVFDPEGLRDFHDPDVIDLAALRELGRIHAKAHPKQLDERVAGCRPQDLAILVYTSGTTGRPKGAMHSHGGLVYTVQGLNRLVSQDENDQRMCFLPLVPHCRAHGRRVLRAVHRHGAELRREPGDRAGERARDRADRVHRRAPRVGEVLFGRGHRGARVRQVQQMAYAWSIGVGSRIAALVLEHKPVGAGLKLQFTLARWLALNNVRKTIGIHRARFLVTGAAPISPDLVKWYLALGVPMGEVWGLTETCGASTYTPPDRIKPGMIGPACPYNEVKIDAATGEILVRGKNVFMGYLNLPEKTAETIDAGRLGAYRRRRPGRRRRATSRSPTG